MHIHELVGICTIEVRIRGTDCCGDGEWIRLHDIELYYSMAVIDYQMQSFWVKHPMIRKIMLTHPEAEWIWWMDSDAFFTDMTFEIPFDKYKDHNMVLHGFEEKLFVKKSC